MMYTVIILFSILCGIITQDYYYSTLLVLSGLMDVYLASVGKIGNYVFGIFYTVLTGIIYFQNHLYGLGFISLVIMSLMQVYGIIEWKKKQTKDSSVKMKRFDFKTGFLVILTCLILSLILSFFLSLIPNQTMPFLDSITSILCICQVILLNLRYFENWIICLVVNLLEIYIWINRFIAGGEGAIIMIIVCIWYIIFNIYALYNWSKGVNKNRTNS